VSRRRRQLVATAPKWLVKIKVAIRRCGCSGVREALGTGGGRRQASAIDAREDVWEKEQAVNVSCLIDGAFQRRRACAICTLQLLPQGQTLTRCCPSALRVVRDGARLDVGAGSEGERGAGRRAMGRGLWSAVGTALENDAQQHDAQRARVWESRLWGGRRGWLLRNGICGLLDDELVRRRWRSGCPHSSLAGIVGQACCCCC
jgi:hypothetical protein